MGYSFKTNRMLKTKSLSKILKEFKLPLSPSLGSMISILGGENVENWDNKVFVKFTTDQSNESSWKVLFNLCDVKKLAEFTETFKELLLHISVIEQNIMDFNMNDYERRNLYDQIDDDIYFLSEKFIECIDLSKFKEIKN
jgi:hypothetical protein